ncbi:MAG: hypothetical protein GF334_07840, partial [Candidatus Altiarchaeales archaeon]|nr:hypothetical protein [Candidatus Altiarchaeales archaeon]
MWTVREKFFKSAIYYHKEGLNVIPVTPGDKNPALSSWKEYFERYSTKDEITHWWNNGHDQLFNIGVVHLDGFISIDIDHDQGIY